MGKASSAKKVARAARTGGGRTRRGTTSWVWPSLMAAVVVLGTAGIVYSRDQRQPDNSRPIAAVAGKAGDHWHAAIGFYVCGTFVPNLPEGDDPLGIHGHGDGVVHIHPFGASSSGKRATLGVYLKTVGADVTSSKLDLPAQSTKHNGDKCESGAGTIQAKVWDTRAATDQGHIVEGDPSAIRPQNGQLITIAFVAPGTDIPKPPSEAGLDRLTDVGTQPTASTTTTSVDPNAPVTSTTVASTSTTSAPTTTSTIAP